VTAIPFHELNSPRSEEGNRSVSDIINPLSGPSGRAAAAPQAPAQFRGKGDHFRRTASGPVVSRRTLIKAAAGTAAAVAGGGALLRAGANGGTHFRPAVSTGNKIYYTITASDGWIAMPREVAPMPPTYPDPWGVATGDKSQPNYTTFIFGFRDLSDSVLAAIPTKFLSDNHIDPTKPEEVYSFLGRGKAQLSAPILHMQVGDDVRVTLKNVSYGHEISNPDLHTIHFHGFPNQIAYFDGVPDASLAAPPGHELTYRYIPEDPGTYMWHCHIDDVEHVNQGLTGVVFVAPRDPKGTPAGTGLLLAYDDPSWTSTSAFDPNKSVAQQFQTGFDRQFPILVSEVFQQGHFNNRHLQDTDWTDYNGTFRLLNGRAWPDTIEPSVDPITGNEYDKSGKLTSKPNLRLRYQPNSSLIEGVAGETILIRLSNLGFEEHSLVIPGLPFTLIGRDAKFLGAGRPDYDVYVDYAANPNATTPNGTRGAVETTSYRVDIGPGESRDLLIKLPPVTGNAPVVFPFYDRQYGYDNADATSNPKNPTGTGYGGMRTEIRVYPAGHADAPPVAATPAAALAAAQANAQNTVFPTLSYS
jgi:hypothetical protein